MTEITTTDEGGEFIKLIDFGHYRSSFYGKPLSEIVELHRWLPDFKFRDGDILVASYPKTGCTWTHELVSMILSGQSECAVRNKMTRMLEVTKQEDLDSIPSPRLLNTHIPYPRLPADFTNKRVRTIFLVRNPKDAAVSLYNHMIGMVHYKYQGKFSNWLPLYLRGELTYVPYYEYLTGWETTIASNPDMFLVIYYENLKQDTEREVRRIGQFLGVDLSEDTVTAISTRCQFQEMKNRSSRVNYGSVKYKEGTEGFFRKGEVGDWKNWFTVSQSELFDKVFQDKMSNSHFKFVYKLR